MKKGRNPVQTHLYRGHVVSWDWKDPFMILGVTLGWEWPGAKTGMGAVR